MLMAFALAAPLGACNQRDAAYQIRDPGQPTTSPQPTTVAAEPQRAELPTHRFNPPAHRANRYVQASPISLAALPALEKSTKCFNAGAVAEGQAQQVATRNKSIRRAKQAKNKKKPKKKSSQITYDDNFGKDVGGSAVAAETKSAPATASPPPAEPAPRPAPTVSAESAPSAPMDDMDGGADEEEVMMSGASAPSEDSPRSAPPSDIAVERRELDRDRRRARRKAAREDRKFERAQARANRKEGPVAPSSRPAGDGTMAEPEPEPEPVFLPPIVPPQREGWGAATYLSNDDTMSLSSAQRVNFAIDQFEALNPSDIRKHELLNWAFGELEADVQADHVFSVEADFGLDAPSNELPLAVAVHGRRLTRRERRNAALTLVVDVSGSMRREGRMEYLQRGLLRMARELKSGDIVNLVAFDNKVCPRLSNFVVGRDDMSVLTREIHALKPRGATNLHAGLTEGYTRADQSYQPTYSNRVLLVTDALANRGVTDARTLSMVSDWHDSRRIRLSGVGVGREFNDRMLDQLTEKGRGAYVFLGSEAVVDELFGRRFVSLIETVANDVHLRLHLPPTLRIERFHGEQASTDKAEVQAVHFFANTSQVLLSEVQPWQGELRDADEMMLEIEYQDARSGKTQTEFHVFTVGDAKNGRGALAQNAVLVTRFSDALTQMAMFGVPAGAQARAGGWRDPQGLSACTELRQELTAVRGASWQNAATGVWDRYCSRYDHSFGRRPSRKR